MSAASAPPPFQLFAVHSLHGGPWDWSRDMREQERWKEHAAFMNSLVDEGLVLLGGPLGGDLNVLLIFAAPSAEAVRERLAQDPWVVNGLLTVERIERWTILISPPAIDAVLLSYPAVGVREG